MSQLGIVFILLVCASACFGGRARRHAYICWTPCCIHVSQTMCSGPWHVHDDAKKPQRLLDVVIAQVRPGPFWARPLCCNDLVADALQALLVYSRRFSADHHAPLHTDAQLSFSRSRVHVCLFVTVFKRAPDS